MAALEAALLLGEIHYLIVSACLTANTKWLSAKEVYEKTQIDPIDMHHALAELKNVGIVTIEVVVALVVVGCRCLIDVID